MAKVKMLGRGGKVKVIKAGDKSASKKGRK